VSGRSPTLGRSGGEHRVLEPAGAVPLAADRLDALAELWDGELRLSLESVVLSAVSHRGWVERLGASPMRLAAAFAETVAERGGLAVEWAADAVLLGHVEAVGSAHPHPVTVGERVGVTVPAAAVPLFAVPDPTWDGGRVVPVRGHAVVAAGAPTIPIGDAPAALGATITTLADLPTSLAPGRHLVVVGVDRPAGAVAVAVASAQLRHVTGLVGSLAHARLARALGADGTAVVALGDAVASADHVAARLTTRPDLAVLADPAGAALAARLAPAVQVLTDPVAAPTAAADVVRHARAAGRAVAVHAGRGVAADRGGALRQLLGRSSVLTATLRWQAGLGDLPTITSDDDLETT
jgi:L-erythro-3,5-diaminohexanoate dehydrogenase